MKVAYGALCCAALMGCAVETPTPAALQAASVAPTPEFGDLTDAARALTEGAANPIAYGYAPAPRPDEMLRGDLDADALALFQPGTPEFDTLATDDAIIGLIKEAETLKLSAYRGPAGHWLIGYGHKGTAKPGMTVTEAEAERLLRMDLASIEAEVRAGVTQPIQRREFSAMVELAYNVGPAKFLKSSILRKFNAGDRKGAADAFLRWNKMTVNGEKVENSHLTMRRTFARKHFLGENAG